MTDHAIQVKAAVPWHILHHGPVVQQSGTGWEVLPYPPAWSRCGQHHPWTGMEAAREAPDSLNESLYTWKDIRSLLRRLRQCLLPRSAVCHGAQVLRQSRASEAPQTLP